MKRLFTFAIFFSATLLFMVQPLTGKILLPVVGGSASVWSTCLVFFQAALLVGYLYTHALGTWVPRRWQGPAHLALLITASLTLPISIEIGAPGPADPRWWLLRTLTATVGLPFVALSASAPLLQQWFSRTSDPRAGDPYFLYAASNAGSLLGLLAYPFLEPFAPRSAQAVGWSAGFWCFAALIAACAYASARATAGRVKADAGKARTRAARSTARRQTSENPSADQVHVPGAQRWLWIGLALVPSALLLGVTQHLSTDVVSAPFLWVLPLALYLITMIVAFSAVRAGHAVRWGSRAAVAALIVLVMLLAELRYPLVPITAAHLIAFAVLAMVCHVRLAELRPAPARLTEYFLCISFGGVLGGAAAALVAPIVFSSILEYPLAITAVLLLRPQTAHADRLVTSSPGRWAWRAVAALLFLAGYWIVAALNDTATLERITSSTLFSSLPSLTTEGQLATMMIRASLAIPAIVLLFVPRAALLFAGAIGGLLAGASLVRTGGEALVRERTFFGMHEVTAIQNGDWHVLTHGTTTHGIQATRGKLHNLPTAYYHPSGPLGDVLFALSGEGRFRDVGAIGLGAGALAAYAGNGTRMDFFEIDDAVIRIAENPQYFTYLTDARARPGVAVRTMAVDGRLGLAAMPSASYDLIVIDAFSSDAIPSHLITREAVALYESRLEPRGVMAFHVSSRFFDLRPVLAGIAGDRGLVAYARDDQEVPPERVAEAMRPSVWVVLARDPRDLGQLAHAAPRWIRLTADPGLRLWTDDYTDVLSVLQ